jgi:hypothetical protein
LPVLPGTVPTKTPHPFILAYIERLAQLQREKPILAIGFAQYNWANGFSTLGNPSMAIEIEATCEDGVLKPDQPLLLSDHERVMVRIEPHGHIRQTAGLIPFSGDAGALGYLLGPDNLPWERS